MVVHLSRRSGPLTSSRKIPREVLEPEEGGHAGGHEGPLRMQNFERGLDPKRSRVRSIPGSPRSCYQTRRIRIS